MTTTARATHILRTKREIAEHFHVHPETVVGWFKEGAPIVDEGGYVTEAYDLWLWLREHRKRAKKTDS